MELLLNWVIDAQERFCLMTEREEIHVLKMHAELLGSLGKVDDKPSSIFPKKITFSSDIFSKKKPTTQWLLLKTWEKLV